MLTSIYLNPAEEEKTNFRLMRRWQEIEKNEVRFKEYFMDGAKLVVMGFGSVRPHRALSRQGCPG